MVINSVLLLLLITSTSAQSNTFLSNYLALKGCAISATNNKVNEKGRLIVTISYTYISFTNTNIDLLSDEISTLFPGTISSSNVTYSSIIGQS